MYKYIYKNHKNVSIFTQLYKKLHVFITIYRNIYKLFYQFKIF